MLKEVFFSMSSPAVDQATAQLLKAIRETDTYTSYIQLKESVLSDAVNQMLLERFVRAQSQLQLAAFAGVAASDEDTANFEYLSGLVYQSEEMTDYLLAQMRVQQLVAKTMSTISQEVGLDVNLPEL